jgi:hypothetical protein
MKDLSPHSSSRRSFLRGAAVAAIFSPALGVPMVEAQSSSSGSEDIAVLGSIVIDNKVYEHDAILKGSLRFLRMPKPPVIIQWIDSFGRIAGERVLPAPSSLVKPLDFSFDLRTGLTYINSVRVKANGVVQAVSTRFMRSPTASPWNDYQVITWAYYPDGYYDQLRAAGVNATIAYRDGDFSTVLDNDFNFYVEQMAWEVYANYHKDQPLWRDTLAKVRSDRANLDHWVRKPCLNDPETQKYVRERLQRYVRQHRAFRPLYYTIADELGQGDQLSANDFCHSTHCAIAFAEYLKQSYSTIQDVRAEWALSEVIRWDDEAIQSGNDWMKSHLMINRTTTDAAFASIALANLVNKYGTVSRFNKEWGTTFPEPRGGGMGAPDIWEPVLDTVRESLSIENLTEEAIEKALGPLEHFNVRCGNRAGWNAPHDPTKFKSWSEVKAFFIRFDKELGEVKSIKGWNISPWSDFRNFMDSTYADAVLRAAAVCKAEDPHAICATEGGQAPFAFGWYNYEQVVRAVDAIEAYNIGNNVEVIRSLKPETIMLSTVGYNHKLGTPMTAEDRLRQRQEVRPVWWALFHSHQGTIIWDAQEEGGTFVDLETGQLTPSAETFSSTFRELRSGLGMLVMNSTRTQDGIAIHYSHPSVQAHWLLENVKKARQWMVNTIDAPTDSRFIAVRNSWTKLIEDLQVQYDFVSATAVATGELNSGKYKVFIMPESIAISAAEADQIREFVRSGGTIVADSRAALLSERCRDLGKGQLNEVFGIGEGEASVAGATVKGDSNVGSLQLAGKDLGPMTLADGMLMVTTGKALAHCGDVPMLIVNNFGDGKAVYLNMNMSDYAFERLNPNASGTFPDLMKSVLELAKIRSRVRVLGSNGKRLPGTEVVILKNGVCDLVAIFRNPQSDDGGWGSHVVKKSDWRDWTTGADNFALEKEAEVTIEWGSVSPTYDVRAKKELGSVDVCKATLNPFEPLVFTRSPRPLPQLHLSIQSNCTAGSIAEINLSTAEPPLEGTVRVVHFEFINPSGQAYELYSRNVMMLGSSHTLRVPIAFNDLQGSWSVRGHDLMSGQILEASFNVIAHV